MKVTIELKESQVKAYKQIGLKNRKQIVDYLTKRLPGNLNEDDGISPNITPNVRRLILDNPPNIYNEKEIIGNAKVEKYLHEKN